MIQHTKPHEQISSPPPFLPPFLSHTKEKQVTGGVSIAHHRSTHRVDLPQHDRVQHYACDKKRCGEEAYLGGDVRQGRAGDEGKVGSDSGCVE